jgi:hypothetical protein
MFSKQARWVEVTRETHNSSVELEMTLLFQIKPRSKSESWYRNHRTDLLLILFEGTGMDESLLLINVRPHPLGLMRGFIQQQKAHAFFMKGFPCFLVLSIDSRAF